MTRRDHEYRNFEELSQHETENIDFRILVRVATGSEVAILAPHGGKIEPLTSELANSIAGQDHSFYTFEGIKPADNADLHITSTNFDEPQALSMVAACQIVVTIHGLAGDALEVQVGGRDDQLVQQTCARLQEAGFASKIVTRGQYGGASPYNICNRGKSGAGVQLEIRAGLRGELHASPGRYAAFVKSVRSAITASCV